MTDRSKTVPLMTRVSKDVASEFKHRIHEQGLSVNQYLKLLVLMDLGRKAEYDLFLAQKLITNHEEFIEATKEWLRGK